MAEERDCLIGLAPKYDAKETARQAAIEALQQHRYLDASDCAKAYSSLCKEGESLILPSFKVAWQKFGKTVYVLMFSRKNAERFAAHVGGTVENHYA